MTVSTVSTVERRSATGRIGDRASVARGLFVGLSTLDVAHRVERSAGPDEKVTALRQDVAAGGPALGAALVHAALSRGTGTTTLVTALADDPAGAAVRADLARAGVDVVAAAAPQTPVSAVRVLAATGQRSVTSLDAAGAAAQPPPGLADLVSGAAVLLLDGHHAELAGAAARAVRDLRAAGRPAPVVLLDAGRWRPVFTELLAVADVVVAAAAFAAPGAPLRERGVPFVAATAGAGPVRWWERGGARGEVVVPVLPPGAVLDTLGAGDALHGAVAWALGRGRPPAEALELGVAVAGLRVQQPGARAWADALAPSSGGVPLLDGLSDRLSDGLLDG